MGAPEKTFFCNKVIDPYVYLSLQIRLMQPKMTSRRNLGERGQSVRQADLKNKIRGIISQSAELARPGRARRLIHLVKMP